MNTQSGITGERRSRRSPALLLVALVALTSTGSASAHPARGQRTPNPSQRLATLLSAHEARARPTPLSPSLGLVPARTPLTEQRTVLPVLAQNGQWLRVRLPGRPNGHTGWIRSRATSRTATDWRIVVDESTRRVTVYRAGHVMRVFTAIVGKPTTPTPRGQFFVEESIALQAWEPGAPFALALSARSNVYQEFHGGPGQIALHGLENVGGALGTAVSHGCVRLGNDAMRWLVYRVGPGSPVTVTS